MWSYFSKNTSALANFDVQEQVVLDTNLQQKIIWCLNNAKKKGNPQSQSDDLAFSAFTLSIRVGNETWVIITKNKNTTCGLISPLLI